MSHPIRRSSHWFSGLCFGIVAVAGLGGDVAQAASIDRVGRHQDELAGRQISLDENCVALQADSAEALLMLSPAEQPGQAVLLGLADEGSVLWEQPVPWQDDHGYLNPAKTWGSCEGRQLTLYSQLPGRATTFVQQFDWTGRSLHFISHDFEDLSAEILEAAIVAVETQGALPIAPEGLESPYEGLMYPHQYIHRYSMGAAIARGHAAALARYEAGETEVTAKILREMFELTRSLKAFVRWSDEAAELSEVERWVSSWQQLEMESGDYVGALNDYGFFLQELGEHQQAIAVFEQVLLMDGERTVAYLNLADSLWESDRQVASRDRYQAYARQMAQQGWNGQIPLWVHQRL